MVGSDRADHRCLEGKVAVITGASRGLGRAIARAYVLRGARVAIAARDLDALVSLTESMQSRYRDQFLPVRTDVSEPDDMFRLATATQSAFSRIDIWVNNAGVGQGIFGRHVRDIRDVDISGWDHMFAVNVRAAFFGMQAALGPMCAQKRGSIINVTSRLAQRPDPGSAPYGPSKAALNQLGRVVSAEFANRGIRVNGLHPGGPVDTAIFTPHYRPKSDRVLASPDVVCPPAIWLGSDGSVDTTGEIVDATKWNSERAVHDPCVQSRT